MSDLIERLEWFHEHGVCSDFKLIWDARDEIERLEEALQRIVQWADAYPTDMFHEPTPDECQKAHKLLTANGMTLDAFSASMGRHCLRGVGDIARRALEPKPSQPEWSGCKCSEKMGNDFWFLPTGSCLYGTCNNPVRALETKP